MTRLNGLGPAPFILRVFGDLPSREVEPHRDFVDPQLTGNSKPVVALTYLGSPFLPDIEVQGGLGIPPLVTQLLLENVPLLRPVEMNPLLI